MRIKTIHTLLPIGLLLAIFFSCNERSTKQAAFSFVAKYGDTLPHIIDPDSLTPELTLSEDFWNYFTYEFNTATIRLFAYELFVASGEPSENYISYLPARKNVKDSSRTYTTLSYHTRVGSGNDLPKSLKEDERYEYWDNMGFFVVDSIPDSLQTNREKVHMVPSLSVQREYEQFYKLMDDYETNYIIIIEKQRLREMLRKKFVQD